MAVEVAVPIEEILVHIDPNLDYGPDWMPTPAPPRSIPVLGARGDWSDVFDWIKAHAILPEGTPIDDPFGTIARTQQMIDASMGETVKALSGFMNRTAALVVQAAALLDDAITNESQVETYDFSVLSQRLDQIQQVQDFMVGYAFPAVEAQIAAAEQHSVAHALQAIEYSQRWTTQNVLVPLVESLGSLETRMTQVIDLRAQEAHQISAQQVAGLSAQLAPSIATALAMGKATSTWVDECGAPMCEAMGPKTDLGKLLKALKIGMMAALLAELASLDANALEQRMGQAIGLVNRIASEFANFFGGSGETLGELVTGIGG